MFGNARGPADLRLRQQRTALPAGRRRANRRSVGHDGGARSSQRIAESLQTSRKRAGLQSYEIPRDFIIETAPFTLRTVCSPESASCAAQAQGALRRASRAAVRRLGRRPGQRAARTAPAAAPTRRCSDRQPRPPRRCSAPPCRPTPDAHFTDLGGDSLSALTFANLLHDIFGVEVPVGVIISPANDLQAVADYVEAQRQPAPAADIRRSSRRGATEVRADELTLDKFIDAHTGGRPTLPRPTHSHVSAHRRHRLPGSLPGAGVAATDGIG